MLAEALLATLNQNGHLLAFRAYTSEKPSLTTLLNPACLQTKTTNFCYTLSQSII